MNTYKRIYRDIEVIKTFERLYAFKTTLVTDIMNKWDKEHDTHIIQDIRYVKHGKEQAVIYTHIHRNLFYYVMGVASILTMQR